MWRRLVLSIFCENYEFKSDHNKAKWDFIKTNLEELTKEECRKYSSLLNVLISIKRLFNKTPITVKTSFKQEDLYYREFALFILVNYSNVSFEEIAQEFSVEMYQLENYKNKGHYEEKYDKELKSYFKEKMNIFSHNSYCGIVVFDRIVSQDLLVDSNLEV